MAHIIVGEENKRVWRSALANLSERLSTKLERAGALVIVNSGQEKTQNSAVTGQTPPTP